MFEASVVKTSRKTLCTSYFALEGYSSLMFTATNVFKSIYECYNDGFDMPSLEKAAQDTSMTLNEIISPMLNHQHFFTK